jgi:DNA replication and repair protein RecF
MGELILQNFRNHVNFKVNLKPGITLITGLNGSGKTSVVEAIYLAFQGKSWRSNFQEIVRKNQDWWRIDLNLDREKRTVKFQNGQKSFEINGKITKLLPGKNRKQIILFEPEDTRILYGSPKRRRDFIDRFISQIDAEYMIELRQYNRTLLQRNKLLKQEYLRPEDLLVWDIKLAETGAKIIKKRSMWIDDINQNLSQEYQKLCGGDDTVKLVYKNQDNSQQILTKLNKNFAREKILGHTTVGPHKDDIEFLINNSPANKKVSRGEGKLILLMIFIILIKKYNIKYVIFDDLFNEIDIEKVRELEKVLSSIENVFITDCRLLDENFGHKITITS